jgi:hypothetical protein
MKDSSDPPRLTDPDSPASGRLRQLIEECRADVGTDTEIQKLRVALGPMLWPGGAGSAGSGAAAAKGAAATALKVGVGALAIAGAGALFLAVSPKPESAPRPALPAAANPSRPAVQAPSLPESTALPPPATEVEVPQPSIASSPSHHAATDSLSESDLLGQAQAALAGDPARAFALSEQHRRRFSHGVLVQEREVIAVEALARLGRHAEATARGERFLVAFPSSAHRSKIESIVGGK